MKTYILVAVMVILSVIDATAATITLKDGRTITGAIIEKDKNKIVVSEGNISLTYYTDQIVSIENESAGKEKVSGYPLLNKEQLADRYLRIIGPDRIMQSWVNANVDPDKVQTVLSALTEDKSLAFNEYYKLGLMKYLTISDLLAIDTFYTSPQGKQFLKDYRQFQIHTIHELHGKVKQKLVELTNKSN